MQRIRLVLVVLALAVLVLGGCGEPLQPGQADRSEPASPVAAEDAIWFEVFGVSETATGDYGWYLASDADMLGQLWDRHGFSGPMPDMDFATRVVLVAVRAEDACPDDLVEIRLSGGVLQPTFLPPPGGCEEPLLTTAHAVALHRGDLPEQFTAVLRQHEGHGGDVETQLSLPPYDGPAAPAPPVPPRQMSAAALDAVFDGHPLRRCDEMTDITTEPVVDGPLDDDADVAEAQRGRAGFGLPSDRATTRALVDDPDADRSFGFPMTAAEHNAVMARNAMEVTGDIQGAYAAEHADTFGVLVLDQADGGTLVVGVTDDLEGHRARLGERHPDVALRVVQVAATERELRAAQEALRPLHDDGTLSYSAFAVHLTVGVVDPTREDLDAIAALVAPAFTCVEPVLSGLP